VTVSSAAQGDWIVLTVADEGPGMRAEDAERLFERYARADSRGKAPGTGLGLWIARSIARAYGGDAWYEPQEPHGARFRCRLPLSRAEAEKGNAAQTGVEAPSD
jgi:two-component system OmpR family sensor kinase